MAEVKAYPGMEDFIAGRISALEKKASAPHKETEQDKEKNDIKASVLAFLQDNPDKQYTITQLMKEVPGLPADISNQKLTALVRQLLLAEQVSKVVEKRVSYFTAHKE
jgi:hypothetical protein